MTFTDYVLDITLLALVLRQVRESHFDWRMIALPVAICGWVGVHYLHSLPTAGHDPALIVGFAAVGVLLGALSGWCTRLRRDDGGRVLIRAGWIAAGAWVLGMGFRLAFAVWASHGGGDALARFSARHDITSGAAWTDALVLMAFGEVFVRTAVLALRARRSAPRTDAVACVPSAA